LFVLLSFFGTEAIRGQQSATLTGTVTDPSGAVVADVNIKLVNSLTGESYSGRSNENGIYTIPLVKPGSYELAAEAPGFKQFRQTGIVLETGVPAGLDIKLELGGVTETVTVKESVPLLSSESASVGAVINRETIENMPLINRRAAQLARLNGFVVQVGTASTFMMGGGRGDNANWTIDGGNVQNILLGVATLNFDPPIDSLQEFRVEISDYKAELGRTGGGVVMMTTRSGTNKFHGSLYEFLRNDKLDARNFFAAGKPVLRYNQFGASLGGPIRKNRTFFFINYEGIRQKSQATRIVGVPAVAEIAGDFSATRTTVRDPLTGDPFPNQIVPPSRIDPVGAAIARLYPATNVPGAPSRNNNYRFNQPVDNPTNVVVTRLDHTLSEKDRLYGRLLVSNGHNLQGPSYPIAGVDPFNDLRDNGYYNWSGTWLHNFTATTLMEFRWEWDWRKFHHVEGGANLGLVEKIGLQGTNRKYFPRVNIVGLTAFGIGEHERFQVPIRGDDVAQSITHVVGKHTLKFGWEFRRSRNDDLPEGNAGGTFTFNPVATGDSLTSLLTGWVASGSRAEVPLIRSRADTLGLYAQTDWKVTPSLTLNLGLRWDLDWPRWEDIDNRQNSFDRFATNPICNCPGTITWSGRNGLSKYASNFDYNNFGPHVGFAYRVTTRWVIRGGGVMIYVGEYDQATPISANIGFSSSGSFVSPDGGRTAAFLLRDGMPPIAAPTEADLKPGFGAVPIGQNPKLGAEFFEPGDRRIPYLETFNFNIQRQVSQNLLVEIGYLGTLGHKLTLPGGESIDQVPPDRIGPGNVQVLRPFPQFSDVRVLSPTIGNSNYHGMNVRVEKRYAAGFQFSANYTWSKLIDDVTSRNELGGAPPLANYYDRKSDRGLSGNNIAHRFIWSSVWELPVGSGKPLKMENRLLSQLLRGWSTGLILEARTGPPFGVVEQNPAGTYPTAAGVRSNAIGPYRTNPNWRSSVLGQPYFDPSVFVAPPLFTFGTLGRTVASGPGAFLSDLAILKDFSIRERHRLQFRLEVLNFLNHANFALPDGSRGNPSFGRINSLIGGNEARIIQMGLHYQF
jgi:hypothetical protein